MKTKKAIYQLLLSYEKSYEETKDLEELKTSLGNLILDIENVTPVSPSYSSYLFQMKLDYEHMDRFNALHLVDSLKNFLERLEL
ncbi:hypothetical protein [Fluviicola chungangensis]|uniref:Uncharacterized protein n=1 Tax=Fluviicola chungangensis TaxID=2597671 RepID=A0A556N729_9FLAO|nr:hypothetical protein [Fluviicola chungangensis]TSJ47938.1 hypothetical protein FO442_02055 [Fluviicola chungangensis]